MMVLSFSDNKRFSILAPCQENRQVKWKLLVAKQRLDLATQDSIWF